MRDDEHLAVLAERAQFAAHHFGDRAADERDAPVDLSPAALGRADRAVSTVRDRARAPDPAASATPSQWLCESASCFASSSAVYKGFAVVLMPPREATARKITAYSGRLGQ